MVSRRFYIEVGKLLYSISKADGFIQEKEGKAIHKIIEKELKKSPNILNGHIREKETLLIKISFNTSERNNLSASDGFESFAGFMNKNGRLVDDEQKKIAADLILKVASASNGISKNEKKIIDDALKLFKLTEK